MNMYWLLVLIFCYGIFIGTGLGALVSPRTSVVNIGAIFSFNSSIGKVAKVAIEAAVQDVKSNPAVQKGTKLKLPMQDTKQSSGFLGIVEVLRFMENDTVVAIVGLQESVMAHVISHIANEFQIPLLSFVATDSTLNSLRFPYFVRTTQNDLFQMFVVAKIVSYYGWRDVIAIYIDDDYGRNEVAALDDKLAEKRCKISYKAPMSPKVGRNEISDTLLKVLSKESRVIILHIYSTWGLEVVDVAPNMRMMESGYVWIATDWLSTILDTESSLPLTAWDSIQGVFTLRMHNSDSEPKRKFVSRWSNLTIGVFGLNTYGLYAYDTVWLLAHALDSFLDKGGNISFANDPRLTEFYRGKLHFESMSIFEGGNMLLTSILVMNLSGVTGPIKFTSDGNLIGTAYEVINVIGTLGMRRIGYWSNSFGLSVVPPEEQINCSRSNNLYGVIWPGQTTEKPRGWVFSSNGRQLRVGVPVRISFCEFATRVYGSDVFHGYCIDVFNAAIALLPYIVLYKFIPFGNGHIVPIYTDILQKITTNVS